MKEWEINRKQDYAEIGHEFYVIRTAASTGQDIKYAFTYIGTDQRIIKIRQVECIRSDEKVTTDSIILELPILKAKYAIFRRRKRFATFKPRKCYAMHDLVFTIENDFNGIEIFYEEQE